LLSVKKVKKPFEKPERRLKGHNVPFWADYALKKDEGECALRQSRIAPEFCQRQNSLSVLRKDEYYERERERERERESRNRAKCSRFCGVFYIISVIFSHWPSIARNENKLQVQKNYRGEESRSQIRHPCKNPLASSQGKSGPIWGVAEARRAGAEGGRKLKYPSRGGGMETGPPSCFFYFLDLFYFVVKFSLFELRSGRGEIFLTLLSRTNRIPYRT
jgi:hypothetical protein